ncbi:MAG: trigger factor, partial [Clostridia bacterium]|nr:trigger factor [Clostridia bacterium]
MKLISSTKKEKCRYDLKMEISGEVFMNEVNAVYKKQVKSISIPGFRKGKAPRSIIEREYGEGVFYEDALKNLYPVAITECAKEAGLALVRDKVDIDVEKADKDGVIFTATVTVEPEVSIENYKGITYKPMSLEITDEDVEAEVQKLRERNSRLVTVEGRAAENGDIAVIDFKGILDGEAFEGGTSENYNLTLGSGSFIPGFEDQIIGHNAGEEFTIDVTFPEDYQAENLKGKAVQFEIKLHELKKKELPEFNDDFVKDVSEFETVDSYKADIRTKLEEARKKEADSDKENQVAEKLKELMTAEIPEVMYENQVDNLVDEFEMSLRAQGIDLAT